MPKRAIGLRRADAADLPDASALNVSFSHTNGWDRLPRPQRQRAALDGVRPDPALGNVTQVESTATLRVDSMNAGLNFNIPARRTFLFANYACNRQRNDADGAFSLPADSYDLAARMGPGGRRSAPHRERGREHERCTKNLRLGVSTAARSGAPYNVTTGRDDNGDTVFNDRPAGVGRNSAHQQRHVGRRRRA